MLATNDRVRMLAERSLPSVAAQTRGPDILIVVDDSILPVRQDNAALVGTLRLPDCEIVYLENHRTKGASGAWNTAIDFLLGQTGHPSQTFVAILDDDDAWSPEYLKSCELAAVEGGLDMVACALRRIEGGNSEPLVIAAPESLRVEDFLVTNPGIQGSNLFVGLSVLLAAGGFDEGLRSTTDRDLCIRIAELGTVRYGRISDALVDHFAESERARLSTRGSEAKLDGLTAFWRKYAGRMTADQRQAFLDRSASLFGWRPPSDIAARLPSDGAPKKGRVLDLPADTAPSVAPLHAPLKLYVGVITSEPAMLRPLLDGLVSLGVKDRGLAVAVLVLDNGSPPYELDVVVCAARRAGLEVAVVDEARQRLDAAAGGFGSTRRLRPQGQVGIAMARTMLQRYLGGVLSTDPSSFGWILDDDMRVDSRAHTYLPLLHAYRNVGVDVLIGPTEGSSPNPPLHGLRVQLVDLLHNIHWLSNLPEDAILPDRTVENAHLRRAFPDYYYDLSRRHTAHLESPHWLERASNDETVKEARARLLENAVDLLNGAPLTRPVLADRTSDLMADAKDSVNRGGNTFILNHRVLNETPNATTSGGGGEARRSDMMWAIVNRHYRRMTIKSVPFPVLHLGRANRRPALDLHKVRGELIGSTLYAGIVEFLASHPEHRLDFNPNELKCVCDLADRQLRRRWRSFESNFRRVMGIRDALRNFARRGELDGLLSYLDGWFTDTTLDSLRVSATRHDRSEILDFVGALRSSADDFSRGGADITFIIQQFARLGGAPDEESRR